MKDYSFKMAAKILIFISRRKQSHDQNLKIKQKQKQNTFQKEFCSKNELKVGKHIHTFQNRRT